MKRRKVHETSSYTWCPGTVWVVNLVLACASGCGGYSWRAYPDEYHAAERGRVLRLMHVAIRASDNPLDAGSECLVERCGANQTVSGEVPCWPRRDRDVTRNLLHWWKYFPPDYRVPTYLRFAADSLNREIGRGKRVYVIGTQPLAIAFLEEQSEAMQTYREIGAGMRPAFHPATRDPVFVRESDLARLANVVLVFPIELRVINPREAISDGQAPTATLRLLRAPKPLAGLIRDLAEPDGPAESDEEIYHVPVRQW